MKYDEIFQDFVFICVYIYIYMQYLKHEYLCANKREYKAYHSLNIYLLYLNNYINETLDRFSSPRIPVTTRIITSFGDPELSC